MVDDAFDPKRFVAECPCCDDFGPVGHIGICDTCAAKLDRDMIRERALNYSATAFMVVPEKREALRAATIAKYGVALELIAPESGARKPARSRKRL
jgi:hypothetical protein